ncbi:MAG: hypothetical protein ACOYM8_17120, partial [Caulobacterales bacterium]
MRNDLGRWAPAAGIALLAALIWTFSANTTIRHFYAGDSYLLDSGWLAFLQYKAPFVSPNPPVLGGTGYQWADFWSLHLSLYKSTLALLSWATPQTRVEWYATTQPMTWAGIALCVLAVAFVIVRRRPGVRDGWLCFGVALGLTFSGPELRTVGYPHYETLIPVFSILALACILSGRTRWAIVAALAACAVREDGGLHLACLCIGYLMTATATLRRLPEDWRRWVLLLAVALGGAAVLFGIQKVLFPGASTLAISYLGDPPFAHLTPALLKERATLYLEHRLDLVLPLAAPIGLAIASRDLRWCAGLVAIGPWVAVNLVAKSPAAGQLELYYGFPLIAGFAWPFVWALCSPADEPRRRSAALAATAAALLAASAAMLAQNFGQMRFIASNFGPLDRETYVAMRNFERAAMRVRDPQPGLFFDSAVGALAPNLPGAALLMNGGSNPASEVFALVYNARSSVDAALVERIIRDNRLTVERALEAGPIRVAMREGYDLPEPWRTHLRFDRLPPMLAGPAGRTGRGGGIVLKNTKATGLLAFGPYIVKSPGLYRLTRHFRIDPSTAFDPRAPIMVAMISADAGAREFSRIEVSSADLCPDLANVQVT